jgi:hypothetical protein
MNASMTQDKIRHRRDVPTHFLEKTVNVSTITADVASRRQEFSFLTAAWRIPSSTLSGLGCRDRRLSKS